jgi:hypothetical protein
MVQVAVPDSGEQVKTKDRPAGDETVKGCGDSPRPIICANGQFVAAIAMLLAFLLSAQAQQKHSDLTDRSLEDPMTIEVTSVSKKEQKLSRMAAAIFGITQEDIRRSGAMNIHDLLRMVPRVDVAQINGSTWAVSARGSSAPFSVVGQYLLKDHHLKFEDFFGSMQSGQIKRSAYAIFTWQF